MTLDSRISELANAAKPTVAIIGLGGAGCNIVSWIAQKEIVGSKIIAADTDATHLMGVKADVKILLGEKTYQGKGAGGFAERGTEAARESLNEIKKELLDSNLVFIIAGMGGGSGTGAAPVIAEAIREAGILTIGCVTLPFGYEVLRRKKAIFGIKALADRCDSLVVIDNSRLRA
ncbi:MAG: cell division protein FtsZ, partial [Candidatus Methanoperedens sp.]|nr:cell division protein FtsZ [Candidatus Methanoperedens sp.]